LEYESENAQAGLAIFSEIYYGAGWKVSIDGQAVEHIRVNYVLRGLEVPAGKHKIAFSFEPSSFTTGNMISLIASLAVFALMIGAVAISFKGAKKE
jgi:uncharacterized membrane protein YfhO